MAAFMFEQKGRRSGLFRIDAQFTLHEVYKQISSSGNHASLSLTLSDSICLQTTYCLSPLFSFGLDT